MEPELREILVQSVAGAAIRNETFNGREYLVAPVVMLQEGVIQGANAAKPEYVPFSCLEKLPFTWNGRPLVQNHPQVASPQGAVYVSANSPEILQGWAYGFVFNVHADPASKKLKGEAWIDVAEAKAKGGDFQDTVDRLNAGETIEISTGLYADIIPESGKFNGKDYSGRWGNVISDHLAILSKGIQGACSVEMGCGIPRLNAIVQAASAVGPGEMRVNTAALRTSEPAPEPCCAACAGAGAVVKPNKNSTREELLAAAQADIAALLKPNTVASNVLASDLLQILSQAILQKYPEALYCYLMDATQDVALFRMYDMDFNGQTYQVRYSMDAQGNTTFTGDPEPVITMTSILPKPKVNAEGGASGVDTPAEGTAAPISTQGDPMSGNNPAQGQAPNANASQPSPAPAPAPAPAPTQHPAPASPTPPANPTQPGGPAVHTEQRDLAQPAAAPKLTTQEWLDAAPPEMRAFMENQISAQKVKKDGFIATIKTNANNKLTDTQLQATDVAVLETMAAMAAPPQHQGYIDYGARAGFMPAQLAVNATATPGQGGNPEVPAAGQEDQTRVQTSYGAPPPPRALDDGQRTRPGTFKNRQTASLRH